MNSHSAKLEKTQKAVKALKDLVKENGSCEIKYALAKELGVSANVLEDAVSILVGEGYQLNYAGRGRASQIFLYGP